MISIIMMQAPRIKKRITSTHPDVGLGSWTAWIFLAILCFGSLPPTLRAQTLFEPYDTIPTLSRYHSVEECLAAVSRVSRSVSRARPEFLDTMPFRPATGRDSTPAAVITAAQQCATSFNPDSVVLTGAVETYTDWMQLYLTANRDDATAVVAQRRVAMARQQAKTPHELYNVLSEIMRTYGNVHPARWSKAQETGKQLEADGVAPDSLALFFAYASLFGLAGNVDDTIIMTNMAERMLSLIESMPPELKQSSVFPVAVFKSFGAARFLARAARMDSLRRGPDAFVAIEHDLWKKTSGSLMLPFPDLVGETALPVTGEFWFSSSTAPVATASDHPRPAPGKISLVVFLRQGCNVLIPRFRTLARATYPRDCWGTYASLRRLGRRYPSLEITLVARTSGYSINTGPMSPPEEAAILQQWWLGFHRLPVMLVVATTEFFRLEGADRRRIDQPVPNDVNYLFGRGRENEVRNGEAYLIDTNGMIIHSGNLESSLTEWTFNKFLDVMTQRGK